MRDVRIGAAQFEHRDGDKEYNLSRIRELTAEAAGQGAEIVSFHEGCVTAYTFVRSLSARELSDLAEPVPEGPSTRRLVEIARESGVALLAGLIELDGDATLRSSSLRSTSRLYNTYVCVTGEGLVAKFRKLHPFINKSLSPGGGYVVFGLLGSKCGILICYDNNIIENVRVTTMMGAEIIFMPHVTCCLPSAMPGRGLVDPKLWEERERDPVPLRMEFMGPKGRGWLMRWLPARAYDNGVYVIFTNPVGMDGGQVRNGNSMILDPFGEVVAECNTLGDDVVVGLCTAEKLPLASGGRYIRARRPDLYGKLVEPPETPPVTSPGWDLEA